MKLNREIIHGFIQKISRDSTCMSIGLTIGAIVVGSSMIDLVKNHGYDELDYYSTYSSQIESKFDVDIDSLEEDLLNDMGEELQLVNQYNMAISDAEKDELAAKMFENRLELKKGALLFIKMNYAKENGGTADEYKIGQDDRGDGYPWVIYRNGDDDSRFYEFLKSSESKLVDVAVALGDLSYNNDSRDKIVNLYESVIKESALYVRKISPKSEKGKGI